MQHAGATRVLRAPIDTVWPLVADVTAVQRWHPSVKTADLLSPKPTGLGAARRCNFYDGTDVREEVVDLEEGRRVRLRLSEFSVPMKRLEAEVTLSPLGDGQTEATFELSYEMKFGPLGKVMGALMVRRSLVKVANTVLAGLEHHASTGEIVGKDFVAKAA